MALIGSGLCVLVLFALFLLVGTSLWLAGAAEPGLRSDAIYPGFIATRLPAGLAGLGVAGILAAGVGTHAPPVQFPPPAATPPLYPGPARWRGPPRPPRRGRAAGS